jgi:hypothetical protein
VVLLELVLKLALVHIFLELLGSVKQLVLPLVLLLQGLRTSRSSGGSFVSCMRPWLMWVKGVLVESLEYVGGEWVAQRSTSAPTA